MTVGKIRRVPLREVWPHEAFNFTTWLEQNLDVLSDHLDVPIDSAQREASAGVFNVDLLADAADDKRVVIENQLERSDHDHLGKLLTYVCVLQTASNWPIVISTFGYSPMPALRSTKSRMRRTSAPSTACSLP